MNLVDEVLKHLFADAEIGDDAIFHRADGVDVTRGTTKHAFGVGAHGDNTFLVAMGTDGND